MGNFIRLVEDKVVRPSLAAIAVFLIIQMIWAQSVRAQYQPMPAQEELAVHSERLDDLDRRVTEIEKLSIPSRLTAIETQLRTGNNLQYTSIAGLALLCVESLLRRKRYRETDLLDRKRSREIE